MKRNAILALVLAMLMLVSLTGCNNTVPGSGNPQPAPTAAQETAAPTQAPANPPAAAKKAAPTKAKPNTETCIFTIYNESDYDIYAIYMGPADGDADDDIDILPHILEAGDWYLYEEELPSRYTGTDKWTLYIEDTDGDTSESYETFDPYTLIYVDINWNTSKAAYECTFVY